LLIDRLPRIAARLDLTERGSCGGNEQDYGRYAKAQKERLSHLVSPALEMFSSNCPTGIKDRKRVCSQSRAASQIVLIPKAL
jgi:hypothetical protein